MMQRTLAALLIVTAAAAAGGEALAAGNPVAPDMNNGLTNQEPKTFAVSPAANQITATHVIGADIKNGAGTTIAKITDIIIDPHLGTAAMAIIAPAGSKPFDQGKRSAVAWSSLQFQPRPTPHFVAKLDRTDVECRVVL